MFWCMETRSVGFGARELAERHFMRFGDKKNIICILETHFVHFGVRKYLSCVWVYVYNFCAFRCTKTHSVHFGIQNHFYAFRRTKTKKTNCVCFGARNLISRILVPRENFRAFWCTQTPFVHFRAQKCISCILVNGITFCAF